MKAMENGCPAEFTLTLIGGRWKIPLLFHLQGGAQRFSELARALKGVSQKVLTHQLREMERDGLVARKVYAQVPPRVDYSLTDLGITLRPVVEAMCEWGEAHKSPAPAQEARA